MVITPLKQLLFPKKKDFTILGINLVIMILAPLDK